MPGAGLYLVGANETYKTLQAAVDQLKTDQGTAPFAATQTIRITDSLIYAGCSIDSLVPTSQFRLVLEAATGQTPILSATFDPISAFFGIRVNSIPNIRFKDLRIHGFHQGILLFDSNGAQIINCNLTRNFLYGVALWNSHNAFFVNTTIQESDTLVAMHRSKQTAFLSSTLANFANGRYALWFDWQGSDTGVVFDGSPWYAVNTIFIGRGVPPIFMSRGYEDKFTVLDGNVYWSDLHMVASLYEIDELGVREERGVFSLDAWRAITHQDQNSQFADPNFLTKTISGLPTPYLELDHVSDLPGTGVDPADYPPLTSYETSEAGVDADGNPRGSNPTPGARELTVGLDYDFIDFFAATSEPDTSELGGVERSIRQIEKSVEIVYPRVGRGHFFVRDHDYYLFSEKRIEELGYATWSKVTVPTNVRITEVSIAGTTCPWMRRGTDVWAQHNELVSSKPITEDVRVIGIEDNWDTSLFEFVEEPYTSDHEVVENPVDFFLDGLKDGAPVVLTDGTITDRSSRELVPFEFDVSHNGPETILDGHLYTLHLQGARNIFQNPHFHDGAVAWGSSGATRTFAASPHLPLVGTQFCSCVAASAQTLIEQRVWRRNTDEDMVFSFYAHLRSAGNLMVRVTTYDGTSEYAVNDITSELIHEDSPYLSDGEDVRDWARYAVFLSADPSSEFDPGVGYDALLGSSSLVVADGRTATSVKIALMSVSTLTSDFDAVMISEGNRLERYAGLPYGDEMTLEWEGSDQGFYEVRDLALTPMLNPQNSGFLVIGPVKGIQLDATVTSEAEDSINDVSQDLRWSLPWAKIDGPDKLLCVPAQGQFRDSPFGVPRVIGTLPTVRGTQRIECSPDPIRVAQGLEAYVKVRTLDDRNNPYAYETSHFELLTETERYPGHLGLRELSVPSQLGTSIEPILDAAGTAAFAVIAPDPEDIEVNLEEGMINPPVETWYPVSPINHGNITIRRASDGSYVNLVGDETSEVLAIDDGDPYAEITATMYPVFGTVKVEVGGTSEYTSVLEETLNEDPNQYQFNLDYSTRILKVSGVHRGNARLTYRRRLAWLTPSSNTVIHLDGTVAAIVDDLTIRYDALAILRSTVGGRTLDTEVVYLNPDA